MDSLLDKLTGPLGYVCAVVTAGIALVSGWLIKKSIKKHVDDPGE